MIFRSTKTYGHEVGLSVCFRQWKAESHCRFLHGYAIAVHIEFEADQLDENGWVIDFGGLKQLKETLQKYFDHTLLVAEDDPAKHHLMKLGEFGLAQVLVVRATGCEKFAEAVHGLVEQWLWQQDKHTRVRCRSVTVSEHGANSATYLPGDK